MVSCEIITLQKEWDEGPFLFERVMQQVGLISKDSEWTDEGNTQTLKTVYKILPVKRPLIRISVKRLQLTISQEGKRIGEQ